MTMSTIVQFAAAAMQELTPSQIPLPSTRKSLLTASLTNGLGRC